MNRSDKAANAPERRNTALLSRQLTKLAHLFPLNFKAKNPVLKETGNRVSAGAAKSKALSSGGYVRESDFLTEETFREVLSFQRKRSERSGKGIILMLLDLNGIDKKDARFAVVRHAARALAGLTREISVNGWYRQDAVLGTILAGPDGAATEELQEKIANAVARPLIEQNPSLRFALHFFPGARGGAEAGIVPLFYADLKKKEKKRRFSFVVKRTMDIAGGTAGLLLFLPLFLVLPLLIKATSKGPVLFKQKRIGKYGEKFVFLKFRTMTAGSDPAIHQEYVKKLILEKQSYDAGRGRGLVFKIQDDPRVTSIGRLLRKTSLDELPQFLNVLKGDMSLVGPRPPIPYELENYALWHRRRVMEIKPGITGLWQVEGRSSTTFDEMVRLDLKYAKEWSLWMDVKILLKTPWVVIAGKGAY